MSPVRKRALRPAPAVPGSIPVPPTLAQASAVKALANGEADAGQQRLAFEWILQGPCSIGEWAYRENERETLIMLGRQFAGQQIVGAVKMKLSALQRREEEQHAVS